MEFGGGSSVMMVGLDGATHPGGPRNCGCYARRYTRRAHRIPIRPEGTPMPISVSRSSVSVCKRLLGSLDVFIDKADAHATARKLDPDALLLARLFPDMFHFTRQVQATTDQARNIGRLVGVEPPKFENSERSFAELKARVGKTVAFIDSLDVRQLDESADTQLSLPMGAQTMQMSGTDYLLTLVLPNFYFHLTAAYSILRHNGVELGKRDFLAFR
jgi:hypothetical protein